MHKFYLRYLWGLPLLVATFFPATASAEALFGKPKTPENIRITGDDATGMVTMRWNPVTEDVDGKPIPSENIGYLLYNGDGATIATLRTNSFSRREYAPGRKNLVTYAIRAVAADFDAADVSATQSSGNVVKLDPQYVGSVKVVPTCESFENMFSLSGAFYGANLTLNKDLSQSMKDNGVKGVVSQDGDNGYLYTMPAGTRRGKVRSAPTDLSMAKNPTFIFHKYSRGQADDNETSVIINGDTVFRHSKPTPDQEWLRFEVPLTKYAGKTVEIMVELAVAGIPTDVTDNYRIVDKADNNLSVSAFNAPGYVDINKPATFTVKVHNNGTKPASDYELVLLRDGKAVASVAGPALDSYTTRTVSLQDTPASTSGTSCKYAVEVRYGADEIDYDNVTPDVQVRLRAPKYPAPESLQVGSGGNLVWTAPNLDVPKHFDAVTDGFEDYPVFEYLDTHVGDWTLVAGAQTLSGLTTLSDVNFPDYILPKAAQVLDNDVHGIAPPIKAKSGNQYLVMWPAVFTTRAPQNDWVISPRLQNVEQTVSFYIMSAVDKKTNSYQICYSESDTQTSSFKVLADSVASGAWRKVEFKLPATANYFAIHTNQTNSQTLVLLDDFTFIPQVMENNLKLLGYNVYRDGVKLNEDPVVTPSYVDKKPVADGKYQVSAVYDKGESGCTQSVGITTEVENIRAAVQPIGVEYFTLQGMRVQGANLIPGQPYLKRVIFSDGHIDTIKEIAH